MSRFYNALAMLGIALLIVIQRGEDGPLVNDWHGLGLAAIACTLGAVVNAIALLRE